MTREERIKVAKAALEGLAIFPTFEQAAAVVVSALFPRKLKVVSWEREGSTLGACTVTYSDGRYTLQTGRYSPCYAYTYGSVGKLASNWECSDDTLRALLALRDNPWEE